MEPAGTQEEQRATEDREPTALVPGVQVSARQVLGLHAHDSMHMTTVSARCMRRTRRPTSQPTPRRSPRSSGFPIGRRRAETGEKAKAKAKEKAEEEAMVVDLAKTDE